MWDLSSPTRDLTCVACIGRRILYHWTTREVPENAVLSNLNKLPKPLFLLLLVSCLSPLFEMKLLMTLFKNVLPLLSPYHPSLYPRLPFSRSYIFTVACAVLQTQSSLSPFVCIIHEKL